MKLKNRIILDYDDVLTMCKHLTYNLETKHVDLVVGIKRGGLVPALHLSHDLERPLEVITWQTRDVNEQEVNNYVFEQIVNGKTVVFVDDINDTGRTINELRKAYETDGKNVLFATLLEKVDSTATTDVTALRIDDPRWLVMPWEKI